MSVGRCFYQILVELCTIFKLRHDGFDFLRLAQINLQPFATCAFGAPECAVIVIHSIGWLKVIIVIR